MNPANPRLLTINGGSSSIRFGPRPAWPGHLPQIAERASALYEQHGRGNGHAVDDWLHAERQARRDKSRTVEGLDRREDCERVVATARRGGRHDVGCIVLGRGADGQKVVRWLTVAASVPGFIGFAVGRTTFWDAAADYVGKRATRSEAASRIARRSREWAAIFAREQA